MTQSRTALVELLTVAESQLGGSGEDVPDYLFALRFAGGRLEPEPLMALPRHGDELLAALVGLGLFAAAEVEGLMMAASVPGKRALMAVLRQGEPVILVRAQDTQPQLVARIPVEFGDHSAFVTHAHGLLGNR